ncbi:MAG: hypothetical protein HXY28_02710 [Hydrogenophilaceae bacterium]|jgi:hypothetical protein|nr:hypothetical protein [Hydrogenophilaceae bacterium]
MTPGWTRRAALAAMAVGAMGLAMLRAPKAAQAPSVAPDLLLLDPTVDAPGRQAADAVVCAHCIALEADLVRQWRRQLGADVVACAAAVAFVRWDKALILQGLAREARMSVQIVRVSRGAFRVTMRARLFHDDAAIDAEQGADDIAGGV